MGMNNLTMDSDSRNKIVAEVHKNFFVEAGAGSGKTSMLVNRIVAMVEADIPIDKICAITFTKAAANEFYERFQKVLSIRSNPAYKYEAKGYAGELPEPTDASRERCREALNKIDLCFMGTIDSFCNMIITEHPTEAGIPSNAEILQKEDIKALYRQEYVKICRGDYGRDLAEMARNFRCLHDNPEEAFIQAISLLMDNRDVEFQFNEVKSYDIDKDFKQDRDDMIRVLGVIAGHKEIIYCGNKESAKTVDEIDKAANIVRMTWSIHFKRVYRVLKSISKIQLVKEAAEKNGLCDGEIFVKGREAYKNELESDTGLLTRIDNLKYNMTMTFASECVPIMETAIRDKGAITFFDCLYYLRNMLKRDAEGDGKLIKYIYDRHSYFLIDEFQDTNPMQAEILFYLSAQNPNPDWKKCVPMSGAMFIVGDPKQSIYRFRGADVSSFLNVKSLFNGAVGEVLELSRNFRSTTTMCDYFNKHFTVMLPEDTENQSKYKEIPLPEDNKKTEFQGVFKYDTYSKGPETDEHYGETDIVQVAKIIKGLVYNPNYSICDKNDEEPREIKYSDFMLISKAKTQLPDFMKYFDEQGIPYRVEGKVAFNDCPALQEIYNIYAAVADAKDQISLYAALTGKILGFTQDEMMIFKDSGNRIALSFDELTEEATDSEVVKRIKTVLNSLKKLSFKTRSLSPAALFEKIMEDFKVFEHVRSHNLEVIYYTLELLRSAEKSGTITSLKDGAAYIAELIGGTNEVERCLSLQKEENVVHIANLHKVKGLEAPIVILSYGSSRTKNAKIRIEHNSKAEGYIFSLEKEGDAKGAYITTKQFGDKSEEEKEAIKAEQTRLSYVGATRARNALIMCNSHSWVNYKSGGKYKDDSAWKELMEGDVKNFFSEVTLTASTSKVRPTENANDLYEKAQKQCVLQDRSAEENTFSIMLPSKVAHSKMEEDKVENVTTESVEPEIAVREFGSVSDVHRFPTVLGTATHKLMEILVSTRDKVNLDNVVDEILSEFMTEETNPYVTSFKEALIQVGNTMRSCGYPQDNGLPQLILQELVNADEVYCEVPFCYKNGSEIWNGVMDVVYCKAGKWHIVDYKTNASGVGLDKLYENQLMAYKTAFKTMTGKDADAFTYHIVV